VACRCLLVDDSEEFLTSAVALLSSDGLIIVGTASDGADALRQVEELRPDVVLLDVHLGDDNGLDVARALASVPRAPRVILISSHPPDEMSDLFVDSGAVAYVSKTALRGAVVAELAC
jgi:CheY-like chemotaxis protein